MKNIRTWIYALLEYKNQFILIKKSRGPFRGLYDLPGGKIEHWERHIATLLREIHEEVWIKKDVISIEGLYDIWECFVSHIWQWQEKDEHIIAIIYKVKIIWEDLDVNFIENWWDAEWFVLVNKKSCEYPVTPIAKKYFSL